MYLIYSRKHSRGEVMWWRPNWAGYTRDLDEAGRYTLEEARAICTRPEDSVAIDEADAQEHLAIQRICDEGAYDNRTVLARLIKKSAVLMLVEAK